MLGSVLTCAILAVGATPVPPVPADQAPAPRLITPDRSLILIENVVGSPGVVDTRRAVRVGVRNGRVLPAVTVWEGHERFFGPPFYLGYASGHRLVADRYLITRFGGVVDLNDRKVIHDERSGEFRAVVGSKVFFLRAVGHGPRAPFSFDLVTHDRVGASGSDVRKYQLPGELCPDGSAGVAGAIGGEGELFLYQPDEKPKSLGKGFRPSPSAAFFTQLPVAWLNNGTFVTRKTNGDLVTVDLRGTETALVTVKGGPKGLESVTSFFRDGSGRLIAECGFGSAAFAIDTVKKTATKYEWRDLGHGFEVSWEGQPQIGYTFKLNGKEIGTLDCIAHSAKAAPGHLAVEARVENQGGPPDAVAVWAGEWHFVKMRPNSLVGWVK